MTTTLLSAHRNAHLTALKSVYEEANSPIRWLVIAHNDSRLVNSLSKALAGESAAVLQVSQDTWDFKGKDFIVTIEWALQQGAIKNLVLVGSSQAAGAVSRASLVPSKTDAQAIAGYGKLLEGIHRHNADNRAVQERFAGQMREMLQIPLVHNRWRDGALAVYGLFYRAESGMFLAYDTDFDTYQPLCY